MSVIPTAASIIATTEQRAQQEDCSVNAPPEKPQQPLTEEARQAALSTSWAQRYLFFQQQLNTTTSNNNKSTTTTQNISSESAMSSHKSEDSSSSAARSQKNSSSAPLPLFNSHEDAMAFFAQFGQVIFARLDAANTNTTNKRVPELDSTGASVSGYVLFLTREDAARALCDEKCRAAFQLRYAEPNETPRRKLFFRNLPDRDTERKLRDLLAPRYTIEEFLLMPEGWMSENSMRNAVATATGQPARTTATATPAETPGRIAYVILDSNVAAANACNELDNTRPWRDSPRIRCSVLSGKSVERELLKSYTFAHNQDPRSLIAPSSDQNQTVEISSKKERAKMEESSSHLSVFAPSVPPMMMSTSAPATFPMQQPIVPIAGPQQHQMMMPPTPAQQPREGLVMVPIGNPFMVGPQQQQMQMQPAPLPAHPSMMMGASYAAPAAGMVPVPPTHPQQIPMMVPSHPQQQPMMMVPAPAPAPAPMVGGMVPALMQPQPQPLPVAVQHHIVHHLSDDKAVAAKKKAPGASSSLSGSSGAGSNGSTPGRSLPPGLPAPPTTANHQLRK